MGTFSSVINHYFNAKTFYQVHSPFIFELVEATLEDERTFYAFQEIEQLRKQLSQSQDQIKIKDYGAGSQSNQRSELRTISGITKSAVSPAYQCQILFKLISHLKPNNILELGTSLGLSTLYLAKASMNTKVLSIEGSPEIAQQAKKNFESLNADNIELHIGKFDEVLPKVIDGISPLGLAYLDGNHTYEATMRYFENLLKHSDEKTVLVFDDIYWSAGMTKAWQRIKEHSAVRQTLDLYYFGLVFFNENFKQKEHHRILKSAFKPWKKYF